MKCSALIYLLFVLLYSVGGHADSPGVVSTVESKANWSYLQSLQKVRVVIVKAPGHGHQSANLKMMKRLRELGFRGLYQVIYETEAAPQLKNLLPGFVLQNLGMQQIDDRELGRMELIAQPLSYDLVKEEKLRLGISAANDRRTVAQLRRSNNVETFLQLQPRRWWRGENTRDLILPNDEIISLEHLRNLGPVAHTSQPLDWATIGDASKSQNLKAVLQGREAYDLMPGYAIDFVFNPAKLMSKIISGLKFAQERDPANFQRPIVLPIFTETFLPGRKAALDVILAEAGVLNLDIRDPLLAQKLSSLPPRQIVWLQVGAAPPPIFEAFYTTADLPGILEGKNLTQLMLAHGRAYINVVGNREDIFGELRANSVSKESRQPILNMLAALDPKYPHHGDLDIRTIGEFIRQAKDPHSPVSEFFQNQKIDPRTIDRDLISRSLTDLRLALESRGLIVPQARLCRHSHLYR